MPDPLFDVRTPRFEIPLLFAGQSQKEGFVNELAARLDGLMHLAVQGEATTPPASPAEGSAWLVGTNPTGDWSGQTGKIALRQAGNWLFAAPRDGMRLLNLASGQDMRFHGQWRIATKPQAPTGGTTIDAESRTAIAAIIAALATAGIVPMA